MAIIFDGRAHAKVLEEKLSLQFKNLTNQGIIPTLAVLVSSSNKNGLKYVELKTKQAEKLGGKVNLHEIKPKKNADHIIRVIQDLNKAKEVHGIMVQLPLPIRVKDSAEKILNSIVSKKDVDGLREESPFMSATVRAVIHILEQAQVSKDEQIIVVGSKGQVGKRLIKYLSLKGYAVDGVDKDKAGNLSLKDRLRRKTLQGDVLITATGSPKLITSDLVKQNAVVIDVGAPEGEVDFDTVSKKARFITPVPGGVGPITVVSLMENLLEAASLAKK